MRASCGKVTHQSGKLEERSLIYIVNLSTNFESTSLLGTGQESIEPMLSRYIWEGRWIKCTHHQEKNARGKLQELKQDWVCTISKDIPEEKPCGEDGRANKELSASPPHTPSTPSPAPKTREQSLAGAANQPVCPEAGKWEGNNLLRATQSVKATGAFRSREWQLSCYEHSHRPLRHPAGPHSLYVQHCCVPGEFCHSDFIPFHSVSDF